MGKKCKELYEEITEMLPVFELLLAPKFSSIKEGAAALRTSAHVSPQGSGVCESKLKEESARMYNWLKRNRSRIRMLIN